MESIDVNEAYKELELTHRDAVAPLRDLLSTLVAETRPGLVGCMPGPVLGFFWPRWLNGEPTGELDVILSRVIEPATEADKEVLAVHVWLLNIALTLERVSYLVTPGNSERGWSPLMTGSWSRLPTARGLCE